MITTICPVKYKKKASKIYIPIINSSLISANKNRKVQVRWKIDNAMTMLILILEDSNVIPIHQSVGKLYY